MLGMPIDEYLKHVPEERTKKLKPHDSSFNDLFDEFPFLSR